MKKVLKKFNRTLSIMLAVAMVLTMVPQTTMPVLAAEVEASEDEAEPTTTVEEGTNEDESADAGETITDPENEPDEEETTEPEEPAEPENPEPTEEPETSENPEESEEPENPENPEVEAPEETEEPEEEVVEPTIDTDVSEDIPAEEPGEIVVEGTELNAEGDSYTVTIADYASLKNRVTIKATLDGKETKIPANGQIVGAEDAEGKKPAISLTLTAKEGYQIKKVMNGETEVSGDGTYTISDLTTDATITVTTVAVYTLEVGNTGDTSYGIKVKTGEGETAAEKTVANEASETFEKGTLEFTVDGYTADESGADRIKVYYLTDGSEDETDTTEITGEEKTEGEGESATKKTVYTVSADVINSLDASIKIILEKEEKAAVTVTDNDKVSVQYWGKKKASVTDAEVPAEAWVTDENKANYVEIKSAFVGDTFKFKAVAKANYAISKVKVGDDDLDLVENGEYSVEVKKDMGAISFETVLASTASRTLTFALTGDKDSATAKITSVTPAETEEDSGSSRAATATTTPAEMASALGITEAELNLESGKALSVLASATEIEVTVTPDTAGGYELVKTTADETLESDGSRKVTLKDASLTNAITIAASTQEIALADNSVYFKPSIKKDGETENKFLSALTVATNENVVAQTGENAGTYEIKPGARTVSFTVTAKEGYKLIDLSSQAGYKSVTAGAPAANGDVVYTVTLFAKGITGNAVASPTEFEVAEEAIKVKAKVETAEGSDVAEYNSVLQAKGTGEDDEYQSYTEEDELAFGSGLKATITPADGCQLVEVSYVMGEAPAVTVPVEEDFDEEGNSLGIKAELEIPKMTGDVKITVKSSKSLTLAALTDSDGNKVTPDEDGIYPVEYGKKYLVGATQGGTNVSARDISVVVKDASGAAVTMTNPIISGKRSINLANKNLAGQEITADVSYKGQAVGTYIMSVEKKTTAITVNGGNAIAQSVDSTKVYDFTTDGDLSNVDVAVESDDETFKSLITPKIENGKLRVTVAPAKRADVATSTTTGTGEEAVTTWTSKKATITVSAKDVDDVEASVDITATPLFDEDAAPSVSLVDAADTVLNVNVSMDGVTAPKTGSVWYEVTATAKANTPAQGDTPASNKPDNMLPSVTETVRATGSKRVALQVADSANLGEGAEWGYEVTAKLVYKEGRKTDSTTIVESKPSEKLEAATKTPLFEDALKLKKAKGAPAKLFTGQSGEIVIAEPQWTKKFSSYKILSGNISDNMYGLEFDVNADGNIVVTDVDEFAALGKHIITVVATADQTTNHTMYASRATINVTVAKGINELTVVSPSTKIYKDPKKAASLKTTVEYNNDSYNWNGKKYINAPAVKKVNWSIVDAGSMIDEDGNADIIEAPAYLQAGNTKSGVSVKNGTVTVAKTFTTDPRHANNNRFKVLVEAIDFEGNPTKGLSDTITITTDALDISTLILVKDREVKAVHDIADKKPVEVSASDVDNAFLYALPAGAAVTVGTSGAALTRQLKNAVPTDSLTITSTGKKVLLAGPDKDHYYLDANQLEVLAAGKKAGVKVVTNDGGKKTHTMNMTLDYKATAGSDLALEIKVRDAVDFNGSSTNVFALTGANIAKANKANVKETPVEAEFTTTGAARLEVSLFVGNKADATSTSYTQSADTWATNYKLAVKGGKAISNGLGSAVIITTAKETTLTLTDLSKEAKDAKKKPYVYKLINKAYDNAALGKAPKVKVANALHQYGDKKEQTVVMNVLDADNKSAVFAAGTTVKVEIDWSARNDKNAWMLNYLSNALSANNSNSQVFAFADTNGNVNLDLHNIPDSYDRTYDYTAGSYKVKVTAGTGTGASFKPKTLPATATIKVTKDKAFTFKPTTSYTINKVDGGAVLTGKSNVNVKAGELTYMNFENLQNANLKGTSNKFTHYFKIAEDPVTRTQRLTLNKDDDLVKAMLYEKKADGTVDTTKPIADPVITIPKEDLTGYITYQAGPSVNYYTNSYDGVEGTVKITVKIAPEAKSGKAAKPSQKYGANQAQVALTANSTTEMNVVTNGSYVSVAYAMVDTEKKGNAEQLNVDLAGNAKGQIVVKTTGAVEEGKTYTTNLLIVPNSSFYKELIDKAPAAAAAKEGETAPAVATKQDLIKKYGIAMKVSVLASKTPVKTPDPTAVVDPDEPEPPTPAAKTAADAVALLKDVKTWNNSEGQEIKATIKDSSLSDATTTENTLITAVQAHLDKQEGYTGFTVAKKSESKLALSEDSKTAKVTLTVSKGEDSAEIEIIINAETENSEESGGGSSGSEQSE